MKVGPVRPGLRWIICWNSLGGNNAPEITKKSAYVH